MRCRQILPWSSRKADTGLILPSSACSGRRHTKVTPSPSSFKASCRACAAAWRSLPSSLALSSANSGVGSEASRVTTTRHSSALRGKEAGANTDNTRAPAPMMIGALKRNVRMTQTSPQLPRGARITNPRPLSTKAMGHYQGEENVNARRAATGSRYKKTGAVSKQSVNAMDEKSAKPTAHIKDFTEAEEPLALFKAWLAEAEASEPADPEAMAVATVDASGLPNVRMILLKGADEPGFVFYTNCDSAKGVELAGNPKAALLFHWKSLGRQIRIRGLVEPATAAEADSYFATRHRESRIGACASAQSRPLASRAALE